MTKPVYVGHNNRAILDGTADLSTWSEEELIRGLVALRHEVVHCPLLEVEPLGDELVDVSGYDWVIVTSVNGARELRRRMTGTPARVAAIGRATAEAFGGADLVPAVSTQEGLLAELPSPAGQVLFALLGHAVAALR